MSIPSKDNLTNAQSTKEIDWFFDFSNLKAKARHFWFANYRFG